MSLRSLSKKFSTKFFTLLPALLTLAALLPLSPTAAQQSGQRLWARQEIESPTGVTAPYVATDSVGDVFVTVAVTHLGADPNRPLVGTADFLTIKYGPDGRSLWSRHFRSAGDGDDIPAAIAVDAQGNVIVAGTSFGSGTGNDYKVIKYSPTGVARWSRRYNSPFPVPAELGSYQPDDNLGGMALDPDGNILVTGSSFNGTFSIFYYEDSDDVRYDPQYNEVTLKYAAADGHTLYTNTEGPALSTFRYGGEFLNRVEIASDADGNAIVAGTKFDGYGSFNQRSGLWVGGGTDDDYAVYKLSPSGVKLWETTYDGPAHYRDVLRGLALGSDGSVYLTGTAAGQTTVVEEDEGFSIQADDDIATLKLTPNGTIVWTKLYNETGYDAASDIGVDAAGNVFVCGREDRGFYSWITLKYDADGQTQWSRHTAGSSAVALVPDGQGGVVVTGGVPGAVYPATDTKTVHYDPTGFPKYNVHGAAAPGDVSLPGGLVLDGSGNFIVVSSVGVNNGQVPYSTSTDARVVTTKYAL